VGAHYASVMIACIPVTPDGEVDPRWGRADCLALAVVTDGAISEWQEIEVSWSTLHDQGTGAQHHARVARFLKEHHVDAVIADHVGDGMVRMLQTMSIPLHLDASGDARTAVLAALS